MLYCDRIDISEAILINKVNDFHEGKIINTITFLIRILVFQLVCVYVCVCVHVCVCVCVCECVCECVCVCLFPSIEEASVKSVS